VYDSANPATSSDSRLFAIDQNVTLGRYAASQDTFFADCNTVFSRLLNDGPSLPFPSLPDLDSRRLIVLSSPAVPSSVSLSVPLQPWPVTVGFRTSLRAGAYHLQTASARLFGMNDYKDFNIIYTNRDGTVGTDSNLLFLRAPRTLSNGGTINVRDFSTVSRTLPLPR
jgi:hypothetical protein